MTETEQRDAWQADAQAWLLAAMRGENVERNLAKFESCDRIWRWSGGEGCVFGSQGCPEDALRVCGACRT